MIEISMTESARAELENVLKISPSNHIRIIRQGFG